MFDDFNTPSPDDFNTRELLLLAAVREMKRIVELMEAMVDDPQRPYREDRER